MKIEYKYYNRFIKIRVPDKLDRIGSKKSGILRFDSWVIKFI